jgi:c-di-GMP-binding flagellar brake protein YcgR
MPRCVVDVAATLIVLSRGAMMVGRMTELSASGCRLLLPRNLPKDGSAAIECTFKIRGVSFRLGGVIEWAGNSLAGVEFSAMSSRSRDDLMEVLCEVELENAAKAPATPATPTEPAARPVGLSVAAVAAPVVKTSFAPAAVRISSQTDPPAIPAAPVESAAQGQPPAQPQRGRDRRAAHRCGVDTSAMIDLVKVGSKLAGKIVDLSVGGCRIRTAEKFPVGIYTRIETEFRLHGLPFRLGGVIQAIHDRNTVGIRFLDMSQRKRDQVAELVQEMEEDDRE